MDCKELFEQFAKFDKFCREINIKNIKVKSEVFSYLIYKAFNTFLSIRYLIEINQLDDALCLYRILLENIVNFLYLYKNQDKINDYKSSEMNVFKFLFNKISRETKHMKSPGKLSEFIDDYISSEYISASKVAKEFRNIYKKDKWSSLSFAEKAEDVGKSKLYISYRKDSNLIHSNWFEHRGRFDEIHINNSINTVVVSSCEIMLSLLYTINDMVQNKIGLLIRKCEEIFLDINKIIEKNEPKNINTI